MNGQRILPVLLAAGLCSGAALRAQSTAPFVLRRGLPLIEPGAPRSLVASSRGELTALSYLAAHPLAVTNHPLPAQHVVPTPAVIGTMASPSDSRPECPMPVTRSILTNDSMPVSRVPLLGIESMPVVAAPCANPLSAKP